MNLFSKETDLVHRLVNLILVLWMAGALFFVFAGAVEILVKEPTYTFAEYKINGCAKDSMYREDEVSPISIEETCENSYQQYLSYNKDRDYDNVKGIIIATGNVIIVGGYILLLNKKTSK